VWRQKVSRQYPLQAADNISETCGIVHPIDDHCQEMFKPLPIFNLRPASRTGSEKCTKQVQGRIAGLEAVSDAVFTFAFSMGYKIQHSSGVVCYVIVEGSQTQKKSLAKLEF
jgi:hypothetical protein